MKNIFIHSVDGYAIAADGDILASHFIDTSSGAVFNQYTNVVLGETVAVRDALYIKESDGKAYKASATTSVSDLGRFIGFALEAGNNNDTKTVQISGVVSGFTGLTNGKYYFLSGTAGAILATYTVTNLAVVGLAVSTTCIKIVAGNHVFNQVAGNTLRFSNDSTYSSLSFPESTYTKVKETLVGEAVNAARVTFDYSFSPYVGGGGYDSLSARLYKNGSALGAESEGASTGGTNTTDVTNLAVNDLLQVYVKRNGFYGTGSVYISNFRIKWDMTPVPVVGNNINFTVNS